MGVSKTLYPLLLTPVYQSYVWGGDRIPRVFGRDLPPGVYAESWEVSTRPEAGSVVANGPLAGWTLQALIDETGSALLGTRAPAGRMPLLIKLIDARERLSVQVHPDDEAAARHGGEAKSEMWIVLAADPGATVYAGFRPGLSAAEIQAAILNHRAATVLRSIPVRPGDAIYIPGGRVHSIGEGCLLLEIQQNSNTTYRLDDGDRAGADGKPRALHIPQALSAIRWTDAGEPRLVPRPVLLPSGRLAEQLWDGPHYHVERIWLTETEALPGAGGSFQVLFLESGRASLSWAGGVLRLRTGTSVLVPAVTPVQLDPEDPEVRFIRISLP